MIQFKVTGKTLLTPKEIVNGMFDVSNWTSFKGKGPVPGIKEVDIIARDKSIIDTVFKVKNSDGSHHEERIIDYDPNNYLVMKLHKFSPPLNKFASHFREIWTYNRQNDYTHFERTFELYPKNFMGSILLRFIAYFFKKAVEGHSEIIANEKSVRKSNSTT
jgi:hypothetical protein